MEARLDSLERALRAVEAALRLAIAPPAPNGGGLRAPDYFS